MTPEEVKQVFIDRLNKEIFLPPINPRGDGLTRLSNHLKDANERMSKIEPLIDMINKENTYSLSDDDKERVIHDLQLFIKDKVAKLLKG